MGQSQLGSPLQYSWPYFLDICTDRGSRVFPLQRDPTNGASVLIPSLLSNDSDPDGDPIQFVGVSSLSANGGTVATNGDLVIYTPTTGFTNVDTFAYTISDSWGALAAGLVTVKIRPGNGPPPSLTILSLGGGWYAIHGDGLSGRVYRIEAAGQANAPGWQVLGSATADSFGAFSLSDTNGLPQRFYRLVYP